MPDRRSPTAAERSEALVRSAAEQAATLALSGAERAQADAVARALRDERVDRDLRDHDLHLQAINGSQAEMATALNDVKSGQEKLITAHEQQLAVTRALAEQAAERGRQGWKRWQKVVGALAVLAAYGSIIALVLANRP